MSAKDNGSGLVKVSSASLAVGEGRAQVAHVGSPAARDLAVDLRALGSFVHCDVPVSGADIPLKTLTVMGAGTDTVAHTFSWFSTFSNPEITQIQLRVTEFIETTFPGFLDG